MENKKIIDLKDYQTVYIKDISSGIIEGVILLNKKHTVKEFKEEINNAKEKARKEIEEFSDDWYFIQENINKNFDYIELNTDRAIYIEF